MKTDGEEKSASDHSDQNLDEEVLQPKNDSTHVAQSTIEAIKKTDGLADTLLQLAREQLKISFEVYDLQLVRSALLITAISFIAPIMFGFIPHLQTGDPWLQLSGWVSMISLFLAILLSVIAMIPKTMAYPAKINDLLDGYQTELDGEEVLLRLAKSASNDQSHNKKITDRVANWQTWAAWCVVISFFAAIICSYLIVGGGEYHDKEAGQQNANQGTSKEGNSQGTSKEGNSQGTSKEGNSQGTSKEGNSQGTNR